MAIKVEGAKERHFCAIEAIRIYLPELMKEIDQTTERNESPTLLIKETTRNKTQLPEIEMVFLGKPSDRHIEQLSYFKKNPSDWTTWGILVLSLDQALRMRNILTQILETE